MNSLGFCISMAAFICPKLFHSFDRNFFAVHFSACVYSEGEGNLISSFSNVK